MPIRTADAHWEGTVQEGRGTMRFGSGAFEGQYSFQSRMEDGPGTNPEELIAAAHAGCFSMALAAGLGRAGHPPEHVDTTADVRFEKQEAGWRITRVNLRTRAAVPGIDEATFRQQAEDAKANYPVSQALTSVEITLEAVLEP